MNPPSIKELIETARTMQEQMEATQKELDAMEIEGNSGPVTIVANGNFMVKHISINDKADDLESHLKHAFNAMVKAVAEHSESRLHELGDALPWRRPKEEHH